MNTKLNNDSDDLNSSEELGYFCKVIPTTIMTVPVDEPIRESRYYRQVVSGISELDEGDEIHFKISSPGGMLSGLETILAALRRSPATSIAFIDSECSSAASMLALNCDGIVVSDYCTMLVHFVSFGAAGPSNHVLKRAEHVRKVSEKLFRETYEYFLTEEEIDRCINDDLQIYLDADQINDRLVIKRSIIEELAEDGNDEDQEEYKYNEPIELQYDPVSVAFKHQEDQH